MTGAGPQTSVWHEYFHHPVGGFVLAIVPNVASAATKKWFLSTVDPVAARSEIVVAPWRPYRLSNRPEPEAMVHRLPTFAAVRDPRSRLASVYITRMIRPPVDQLSPMMRLLIEVMSGVKVTPDHPRLSFRQFAEGLASWPEDDMLELALRPQASFLAVGGPNLRVCRLESLDAMLAGLSTQAGRPRVAATARRAVQPVSASRVGVADRTAGEWRRLLGAEGDELIAKPSAVGRGPVLDLRTSEVRDPEADEVIAHRYAADVRRFEGSDWDPATHDWSVRP